MDIVKHIKQHTENLQKGFENASPVQRKNLKLAALWFYFQLPNFELTISKHINIAITKAQLITDIDDGKVSQYRRANEHSKAEIDVYAEDYEELEQIEIFILDAFDYAIAEEEDVASLVGLFIGIIDTLDYYENFSDEPEYWNALLAAEVAFQNDMLSKLELQDNLDMSAYQKRYVDVDFNEL